MNRIVYIPYRTYRDRLASIASKKVPKKVRRNSNDDFMRFVIGKAMSIPGMLATIDCNILVDEEAYIEEKCRTYFPETEALLQMLWRAKMDIDLEDLDLSQFPTSFTIAWPRCQVQGANLLGCMVSIYATKDRAGVVKRFGSRYMGRPLEMVTGPGIPDDEVGIHISYATEKPIIDNLPAMCRCSIPNSFLKECLRGEDDYDKKLSSFKHYASMDLTKEETHQQYVMAKLVIHLLVYMQACPGSVRDGYPEGRKAKEFKSVNSGSINPFILDAPAALKGTHASPGTHWRIPHFRSYPTRRDGTKRKGIVAVSGTVVNADIDPKTVEKKEEVTVA